jgi:hypothetical protein
VRVVDDLLADVDGCAVARERAFDRFHGALDSCAIPPWRCEQDPLNQTAGHGSNGPEAAPDLTSVLSVSWRAAGREPSPVRKAKNRKRLVARGGRWRRASS